MPAQSTRFATESPIVATFHALLASARVAVHQERTFVRLMLLSLGSVLTLGRHTLSQILVSSGMGEVDWTSWYRLFNRSRIDLTKLQGGVVGEWAATLPRRGPLVAAVDGTQLPRTSRHMPGCGYTIQARTPKWRRGIHLAQRFGGISGLLPISAEGESRALPLRWLPLRTAKTTAMGDEPERTEGGAAGEQIRWLREELDLQDRAAQELLVLGDGAYSSAPVLEALPERTTLFARCAKNRALFALPAPHHGRGRPRRYGPRGPTPTATLAERSGWQRVPVMVRGRVRSLQVKVTGPWVVHGAPTHPCLLVVVRGIDRGRGATRRRRNPQFFLLSLAPDGTGGWRPAVSLAEALAWAWQRWEVEVMHRELKSSFGVGEPQAWSAAGATTTLGWMLWVYALVVLAAYRTWGYAPPPGPDRGGWWRPRRWSIGRVVQEVRTEVWQLADFQPGWQRSVDSWPEIQTWTMHTVPAVLACRRL